MYTKSNIPAWIRFHCYGLHGIFDEIIFTCLFEVVFNKNGNRELKGYSTILTFFIYGSCAMLLERLYVWLYYGHGVKAPIRLLLYIVIIYTWELTFGLILRQFGACSWDYSHYTYNFMGLITLEYLPGWLILCLQQDIIAEFLLNLRICKSHDASVVGNGGSMIHAENGTIQSTVNHAEENRAKKKQI